MNPQQAENLRILIRHMESIPERKLDMLHVYQEGGGCGTPACAMGHAWSLSSLPGRKFDSLSSYAERAFGIKDSTDCNAQDSWGRLFGGRLCVYEGGRCVDDIRSPTAQKWATEARKVLVENGYSMESVGPANDGFGRFMDKVREPVPLDEREAAR